jgi:hypothetical protein
MKLSEPGNHRKRHHYLSNDRSAANKCLIIAITRYLTAEVLPSFNILYLQRTQKKILCVEKDPILELVCRTDKELSTIMLVSSTVSLCCALRL